MPEIVNKTNVHVPNNPDLYYIRNLQRQVLFGESFHSRKAYVRVYVYVSTTMYVCGICGSYVTMCR